MSQYTIYPLKVGSIVRQKSNMAFMKDPGKTMEMPLIMWYLTDGERRVLVDTGGTAPDHRYQPYTRTKEQEPLAALLSLGVRPGEITDVILTHLHWDHAGNNQLFPNAVFYVQKAELQYAAAPIVLHKNSYDHKVIFNTEYKVLNGDCGLFGGISVILTPGHSPGSQSVVVDTSRGKYVIVGDLVGLYECFESEPMACSSYHTDLVSYYESLDKIKALGYRILPSHEPLIFEHGSYPPHI